MPRGARRPTFAATLEELERQHIGGPIATTPGRTRASRLGISQATLISKISATSWISEEARWPDHERRHAVPRLGREERASEVILRRLRRSSASFASSGRRAVPGVRASEAGDLA
jgi:hypothetical protein